MFFIGIFGVQEKEKELKTFAGIVCPECGRFSSATLFMSYTYFHIFFIPIVRWNERYYIRLHCCGALFEAEEAYAREFQDSGTIDFSRLKKAYTGFKESFTRCAACGKTFDSSFSYCPYCGTKK